MEKNQFSHPDFELRPERLLFPNDERTYSIALGMNRAADYVDDINENTSQNIDDEMAEIITDLMGKQASFIYDRNMQAKDEESRRDLAHQLSPGLIEERRRLERDTLIDKPTGLANKSAFEKALPSAEADDSTVIILLDLRGFKKFNDRNGQDKGDAELVRAAQYVKEQSAKLDQGERTFRVGGDEFAVLANKDVADYLLYNIRLYQTNQEHKVKTSFRGVIGSTYSEASEAMVRCKQEEPGPIRQKIYDLLTPKTSMRA